MARRRLLQRASAFAPFLFASTIVLTEAGCPKCAAPVGVFLYGYPCAYGPCELVRLDSVEGIEVSYAFEDGPLTPCDVASCGDDSGGCGSDPNGRYRVVAHDGERSWEATVDVTEYSCISGGAVVELTVGDPPPLPCLPVGDPVAPVVGTLTWQTEGLSGTGDFPEAPGGAEATSNTSLLLNEEMELFADDEVIVGVDAGGARWQLRLPVGDLRERGEGVFPLASDGRTLSAEFVGICGDAVCNAMGPVDARLSVELASGQGLPWPEIVSNDFVRRYRLTYDSGSVLADATASQGCEACGDLAISFDLTFERTSSDYRLIDDGSCAMQ